MQSIKIRGLHEIVSWKLNLGRRAPIDTYDDCIVQWSEAKCGQMPDDRTLLQWKDEWDALPADDPAKNPKAALLKEIDTATTIAGLRAAVKKLVR